MNSQNSTYAGIAVIGMALGLLQGCATGTQKDLDSKVANEPQIQNRKALQSETDQLLADDSALSADQKSRLSSLLADTRSRNDQLIQKSLKLRSVLIKDLLSASYNEDEVTLLQANLREAESQRLDNMFDAVKKANSIMGRESSNHAAFVRTLMESRTAEQN